MKALEELSPRVHDSSEEPNKKYRRLDHNTTPPAYPIQSDACAIAIKDSSNTLFMTNLTLSLADGPKNSTVDPDYAPDTVPFGDSTIKGLTDITNITSEAMTIENEKGETPMPQHGPLNKSFDENGSGGSSGSSKLAIDETV